MQYVFWGLIIFIVVLDRWSKNKAIRYVENDNCKNISSEVVLKNKGAAFNILTGKLEFIVKLNLIVLLCALIYLIKIIYTGGTLSMKLALSFMIGGGFGNFIDRLGYGYVLDFIHFKEGANVVFNLADIFILIGGIAIIINLLFI